jgi:hypothetical protein
MIELTQLVVEADSYFKSHIEKDVWENLDEETKLSLLNKSQTIILDVDLRNDVFEKSIYKYAVFEQAIYLKTVDKERLRLQSQGVISYKIDDISFSMQATAFNPLVKEMLKKYIYVKMGEIEC